MRVVTDVAIGVIAYAAGCLSTGYYLARARDGRDLRDVGSGSTGARNAGRAMGRTGFVITLAGDLAKGVFAVWVARQWGTTSDVAVLAALAVVAGHIWPVQLGFAGGKGIATSVGALLVLDPRLVLFAVGVTALGYAFSRKLVGSGMLAVACLPLCAWGLKHPGAHIGGLAALSCLVLFAHRSNLGLVSGTGRDRAQEVLTRSGEGI